jgi:4-amino-4-deoxy-L-arabinose transferase-like glycosyltransferase
MVRRSSHSITESSYLLRLLLALGAILALRIIAIHFAKIDFVRDEAQYWTWSRELAFGYFSKPPMIAWVIRGASELCGNSEACLRVASPVFYTISSFMLYLAGRALYGARVGFWSAIIFDTLPGVSYSSNLITTDVPLILFWSIALYSWVMLVKRQSMGFAVLFGLAVGLGLLAKQAMIYAVLCVALHALVSREAREALKGGRAVVAGLSALALFFPDVIWNAQNGFPTLKHTGTNIGWVYPYFHPGRVVEYIAVQFVVFGPILFIVLLRTAWRESRAASHSGQVLLLSFSMPVLALLLIQSLLSKAHGNWSATAYPAASILVTQVMLNLGRKLLFRISLALHLVVAAGLAIAPAFARQWPLFEQLRFLNNVVGWRDAADAVRTKLAADNYGSILVDTRELASEFLYYLRDVPTPLYVWPLGPTPTYHYEMTRPFTAASPEPVLFVSLKPCPAYFTKSFGEFVRLGQQRVRLVEAKSRTLHFCRLAHYRGQPALAPNGPAQ